MPPSQGQSDLTNPHLRSIIASLLHSLCQPIRSTILIETNRSVQYACTASACRLLHSHPQLLADIQDAFVNACGCEVVFALDGALTAPSAFVFIGGCLPASIASQKIFIMSMVYWRGRRAPDGSYHDPWTSNSEYSRATG